MIHTLQMCEEGEAEACLGHRLMAEARSELRASLIHTLVLSRYTTLTH